MSPHRSRRLNARRAATALSAVVLAALAAALLGPVIAARAGPPRVVAVVDVSESVDAGALAVRLDELRELAPEGLVAFADRPVPLSDLDELGAIRIASRPLQRDGGADEERALHRGSSDLASALELAAGSLAGDRPGRILLLSDGAETHGDAFSILPSLAQTGVEVHTRALPSRRDRARILDLSIAAGVRAGRPTPVELTVLAPRAATLILEAGGAVVHRSSVEAASGPRTHTAEVTFAEPGLQPLAVRLETDDETLHRVERSVPVGPPRRLLMVGGRTGLDPLAAALEQLGWTTGRRAPASLPVTSEGWREWDAVLLDDVDATLLGETRMRALRDWVVDLGGGLLFAAGPSTYGEDGYSESPLEEILPMRFNVEEEKTEVALMIALDKSYSMRGEKIELAKEAAKAVVRELDPEHRFGVVSFDWNPFKVVPLQAIGNGADIVERIGRIEASAQTNFYPALEMCQQQLEEVEAEVKHVILLSDGKTYPDDYQKLIAEMREKEITVSTVAVGTEADRELLADIARWGDGTSYFVQDASKVQSILLDEARSKTEQTLVEENVAVRLVGASPVLDGIDLSTAPPLLGRVNLEAAERAEVLLDTDEDRPLLASRSVGLGRTWMTAFDLHGRWSGSWVSWPGFARLVSQTLSDAASSRAPARALRLAARGDRIHAELEAHRADGSWENGLDLELAPVRRSPDGGAEDLPAVPLRQVAPGRYRADLDIDLRGGEELIAEVAAPGETLTASLLRAVDPEERPSSPSSERLLRDLAEATGGTWSGPLDDALAASPSSPRRRRELWPLLAAAALAVYLLELALRRSGLLRKALS